MEDWRPEVEAALEPATFLRNKCTGSASERRDVSFRTKEEREGRVDLLLGVEYKSKTPHAAGRPGRGEKL